MRTYTFSAKDKEYVLKYTFNSVCDLEEAGGVGITTLLSESKIGLNTFRLLLWTGLKWKDPGITKQRAGNIINDLIEDGGDYSVLASEMLNLLVESVSNDNQKKEDKNSGE